MTPGEKRAYAAGLWHAANSVRGFLDCAYPITPEKMRNLGKLLRSKAETLGDGRTFPAELCDHEFTEAELEQQADETIDEFSLRMKHGY